MSEAQDQILKMLEEGRITAEEAEQLLAAIGPEQEVGLVAGDAILTGPDEAKPTGAYRDEPDYGRFRGLWRIPFFMAAGSLLLSGLGLAFMYQADERVTTWVSCVCGASFFWHS